MTVGISEIRRFRDRMRLLEREIAKAFLETTTCCGVTLSQCHTLLELERRKQTSLKTLTRDLDLDKSTLSRVIDGLVNIGLVSREINPEDRRFMNVALTPNGRQAADNLNRFSDTYYSEIFEHIPADKHEQITESFVLLAEAMRAVRKGTEHEPKE
jgi:DNA-binding MarR family transcriptional regulator